jgi:hypothetical protein
MYVGKLTKLWAVIVVFAFTSSLALGGDAEVSLETSADAVRVYDPLFLKVVLVNRSPRPLRLGKPLGSGPGNVRFEIRMQGEQQFSTVPTAWQGREAGEVLRPFVVQPGAAVASHEVLFRTASGPALSREGAHEIRAVVVAADGSVVRSAPRPLSVRPIEAAHRRLIEEHERLLVHLVDPVRISGGVETNTLFEVAEKMGPSELKRHLPWLLLVVGMQHTDEPTAVARRCRELERLRQAEDSVTAEVMALSIAWGYSKCGEFRDARRVLSSLPHPSDDRDRILSRVVESDRERVPRRPERGRLQ